VLEGNFRIDKELARGGLGIVYRATDIRLKRSVAIKRLNREAYASAELRERFMKEAQLAARLRHPNLAEIFSIVGQEELYLVFELVEGETVHDRIVRNGRLPLSEAVEIIKDTAAAIDYAHSQKIIHRDLKPANLMLRPDGRTKVLDFGIAHETRAMSGATQTQAWGTPQYMAPEQEMGSVCRESDIYALGVVAYELLTGRRPFNGAYLLAMKQQKQYTPVSEIVPTAPPELATFFDKALDPDPEKRFRTASELARALAAIAPTPIRA
jgi:serine/threonine-protein kinase